MTSASAADNKTDASLTCPPCPPCTCVAQILLKQGVLTILFFSAFHVGFTGTIFVVYAADSAANSRAVLLSYVSIVNTAVILLFLTADFIRTGTSISNYG